MNPILCLTLLSVLAAACANDRPQRAAAMDPTNADGPPGEVVVSSALKPVSPEQRAEADDKAAAHHHGSMQHAADGGAAQNNRALAADSTKNYACPMHPEVRQSEPGRCPKCGMKLVLETSDAGTAPQTVSPSAKTKTPPAKDKKQSAQLYTCPMHPEIVQASPGECPKCGMKLVPKASDAKGKDSNSGHQGH